MSLSKIVVNRRLLINDIQLELTWSNKMTKTKAKIFGNHARLSSVLIKDIKDLNSVITSIVGSGESFIDDNCKLWIKGKKLGNGGFSNVYGCKNAKAVLKIFKNPLQLQPELDAYNSLGCSNDKIPKLLGVGTCTDGTRFLVLEKFETDLNTLIKKDFVSKEQANSITKNIIDSLEFIHDKGKLHLDIKPHNIFINKSWHAVVGDLGLLSSWSPKSLYVRDKTARRLGTLSYMSTDVHHRIKPTRRSDFESLGWVLIELFGGRLPWKFRGKKLSSDQIGTEKAKFRASEFVVEFLEKCFQDDKDDSNSDKEDDVYIPLNLIPFLQYVWSLEYNARPDYKLMKSFF